MQVPVIEKAQFGHTRAHPGTRGSKRACPARRRRLSAILVVPAALLTFASALHAGLLFVPNASFESPVVPPVSPYAGPDVDYWQKSPQPAWYDPAQNFNTPWEDLMGQFYNVPFPGAYIDNCDGTQAAFLFALPGIALFQDYNSVSGTNTIPSHAFNATFNVGRFYSLTVGAIGGGGGMKPGATLEVSLYYRDASSNKVTVAATTVTNSAALFPTTTHLVDFSVLVPVVQATNPWAGQNIGVQLASTTTDTNLVGGYWDLDNVRLAEILAPSFINPTVTNHQFQLTLVSTPGLQFDIQATPNPAGGPAAWTSLGTLTNVTGTASFTDKAANLTQRFYRARQL